MISLFAKPGKFTHPLLLTAVLLLAAGCVPRHARFQIDNTTSEFVLFSAANPDKSNEMRVVVGPYRSMEVAVGKHARFELESLVAHNEWAYHQGTILRAEGLDSGFKLERRQDDLVAEAQEKELYGPANILRVGISESAIYPLDGSAAVPSREASHGNAETK